MAKSEVREQATLTPPEKKPPRFGLVADGTSSPAGLIIKIAVLAVVLGIAVWAAFTASVADGKVIQIDF